MFSHEWSEHMHDNLTSPNRFLLIGYLEDALAPELMTAIESRLRDDAQWREALNQVTRDVDSDEHSVAAIWRRHRLTCPKREELGAYVNNLLVPDAEDYIRFHLNVIECPWCASNVEDLRAEMAEKCDATIKSQRRQRFFQSSVGSLPKKG
jgi:hypothetical protein